MLSRSRRQTEPLLELWSDDTNANCSSPKAIQTVKRNETVVVIVVKTEQAYQCLPHDPILCYQRDTNHAMKYLLKLLYF